MAAADSLTAYAWSGNVRELENMTERAIVLSSGKVIGIQHLPADILEDKIPPQQRSSVQGSDDVALNDQVKQFEKQLIEQALTKTSCGKAKAAQLLKISERSLWYKVKKYF